MDQNDAVVAVFPAHPEAETAVKQLADAGFDMRRLSVVGKNIHTEEKVVGFYNMGERVRFWGKNGAFWGALWGLFVGGLFMTMPLAGPVIVLGHLAAMVAGAVEGAVVVGGLSAFGAALYGIGIPKDSVLAYEEAVKADGYLVVAHGTPAEVARARAILQVGDPSRLDLHEGVSDAIPSPSDVPERPSPEPRG